ncbi:MAG: CDP-alcohol phosphatidyltransferase family protein [Chloroflexi bacterium]|nr:CDP-alcohol phosphatidyltransferase family protein [Chloroflexota bacterium]
MTADTASVPKSPSSLRDPEQLKRSEFFVGKGFREIGILLAWLFLHTKVSADQMTVISLIIGLVGTGVLIIPEPLTSFVGVMLLFSSVAIDFADGTVARYRKTSSATGMYLDGLLHSLMTPLLFASLAARVYLQSGDVLPVFLGLVGAVLHLTELCTSWLAKIADAHLALRATAQDLAERQRAGEVLTPDQIREAINEKTGTFSRQKRFPLGRLDAIFAEWGRKLVFGDHFQVFIMVCCLLEALIWSLGFTSVSIANPLLVVFAALLPFLLARTVLANTFDREPDRVARRDWELIFQVFSAAGKARDTK